MMRVLTDTRPRPAPSIIRGIPMLAVFLQGFALSAAMILPLGPQNVFVMNQGIRRQYHLMIASLCALSDIVLICAGISAAAPC